MQPTARVHIQQISNRTMSFLTLLFIFLFACTLHASLGHENAVKMSAKLLKRPIPDLCYKKIITCCWKYSRCGVIKKTKRRVFPCRFKHCTKVCRKTCKRVTKLRRKRICAVKLVSTKMCFRLGGTQTCTGVPTRKRVCTVSVVRTQPRNVCKKVCNAKCKMMSARCSQIRVFTFAKLCPSLSCAPMVYVGARKKPAIHITGAALSVKVSKPARIAMN